MANVFSALSTGYLVGLCMIGALALVMLGLYVEELVFFLQNLHNWKPKDKAIYLLGLYPVSTMQLSLPLNTPSA